MLRATCCLNNKPYFSWDKKDYNFILKNRNSFICPSCKQELVFVDGIEIIKHFRHKVECDCEWEPESENHLEMKYFMKKLLNLSNEDIEVNLNFAQPDLYIKDKGIAIEVQNSNITKKKFLERCYNYTKNGIAVMWIFHDSLLKEGDKEQNIPVLLRTAQENNFGRVYIYSSNKLYSIKFSAIHRWIEEYEDYETGETYGGYLKTYKRKKSINIIQTIPDEKYGNEIYKVRTKWMGGRKIIGRPSGYLMAKFYDI